jgi:hypothetical protein
VILFRFPKGWPAAKGAVHLAAALVLAASLAGCGPAETGLQRDIARQLQERVLSVSQAAAANDHAAALKELDGLDADVAAAASEGKVSEDRRRTIMTNIAAVRADLQAAVEAALAEAKAAEEAAAAAAAAEAQAQAEAESARAAAEAEAAAKAAQEAGEQVVPAPVPEPAPAPAPAPGPAEGKGEGKGKGKND